MTEFTREELALLLRLVQRVDNYNRTSLEAQQLRPHGTREARARRKEMREHHYAISQGATAKLETLMAAQGPLPGLHK
jgi:hypothetical protein